MYPIKTTWDMLPRRETITKKLYFVSELSTRVLEHLDNIATDNVSHHTFWFLRHWLEIVHEKSRKFDLERCFFVNMKSILKFSLVYYQVQNEQKEIEVSVSLKQQWNESIFVVSVYIYSKLCVSTVEMRLVWNASYVAIFSQEGNSCINEVGETIHWVMWQGTIVTENRH